MNLWKLPISARAVIVGMLSLLLAFSGVSTQGIAEALSEASAGMAELTDGAGEGATGAMVTDATPDAAGGTSNAPASGSDTDTGDAANDNEDAPARWTIALEANGGKLLAGTNAQAARVESVEDADPVLVCTPYERAGHTLAGWSTVADPVAWHKERERVLAEDPDAPEPADTPLFVPADASLYNLAYRYVTLEDGTVRQVSDVAAAEGTDDEGREVQTCDLRDRVRNGMLTLYAQWKEAKQEEKGPTGSAPADKPAAEPAKEPASSDSAPASGNPTPAEPEQKPAASTTADPAPATDPAPAATDPASADGNAEQTPSSPSAATDPATTPATSEEPEPVPTNAEPVPNPPAGTAALLANPQLVPDSGAGDEQATALLDAAQKNMQAQELLTQTLAPTQAEGAKAMFGKTSLSLTTQSDSNYPTHTPTDFTNAVYLDGCEIRDCSIVWVTQDSHPDAQLDLVPDTDAPLNMQGAIQLNLSGENNYAAGTVQLKIPAQAIKNREGEFIGSMTIGVPEEPDTSQSFAYRLVNEGGKDYYVLTNTRTLAPGFTNYIQFTIRDITPHMVQSGAVSPSLQASMTLTSPRGNTTTVYTGMLAASVTTSEEVTHAYKNGGRVMETADVPSDLLGNLPAGANADDYVIVRWNSYANVDGNQSFDFDFTDNLGTITPDGQSPIDTAGSLVLGTTEGGGTQNNDGTYTKRVLDDNYLKAGEARYEKVWTAYPKSIFDNYNTSTGRQNNFTITNDVEWKLTPMDDPRAATTKEASASIHYHVPVPVDFSAVPGVYDLTKDTLEPYRYPTSTNVALNTLRKGEDVAIGYTVEGFGETMTYTAETPMDQAALDELAGQIRTSQVTLNDVFHKRYVTMELADDAAYLNGNYATELGNADYYVSRVQLKAPTTYTYMHRDGDETKEWIYSRDGTQPIPSFSLWGLSEARGGTANDWIELVKVSYDARGNRTVDVTSEGSELGVQPDGLNVTLPSSAAITRTKMTAATNWDGLRLAYDVYLSLKANGTTVSGVVNNLFAESDTPATTLRNDSTLMVYRGDYAAETGTTHAPAIDPVKAKLTTDDAQNAIAIKTSANPIAANARIFEMDETRYGQHMYHDAALAYLRGAVPRIGVTSSKSMKFDKDTDLNAPQMQATLHYTAKVHEQSNILTRTEYDAYVREGAIVPETSGTWYDLLPAGVTPVLSTIRLRDQDAVVDSYAIENFENSGRTMLVVKAELTPQLGYNDKVGEAVLNEGYWSQGIYDELQISFDAVYNYADYAATVETAEHQMADQLINVIAFESGNQVLGNQEGMIGEPDDATTKPQNEYNNEETSAAVHGVENLMSGLHGSKTNQADLSPKRNTFVYARDESSVVVDRSAEGEIIKHVASDAEGVYRTGLGTVAAGQQAQLVNVYENHGYTYRLTVAKDSNVQGIILYDALERYEFNSTSQDKNLDPAVDNHRWRGTLASVDVSQLESMGVAPVVYYSTSIEKFDENAAQSTEIGLISTPVNLLFDPTTGALNAGWTKASDYHGDLADVTAIAVDARHKADGTDFTLAKNDKLTAYVHMVAPIDSEDPRSRGYNLFDWGNQGTKYNTDNNKHAFNGVYVYSDVLNSQGAVSHSEFYHPGYTKVGILPYTLTVNKVWDDHDNNDGKRPDNVTVQLLANGEQATTVAGGPIAAQDLNNENNWEHTYEHIPYVDANNKPIHYSLSETPITEEQEGQIVKLYTPSVLRMDETHLQLTNKRTPETVNISGTKTWEDNGDAAGKRPSTITVRLLANGEEKKHQTVAMATDGTWSYEFADMPAYKGGEKITYRVVEDRAPFYAPSYAESELGSGSQVVDGVVQGSADITNTFSATGLLAVQKSVTGAKSNAAKNAQFKFKVELFAEQTSEEVAVGADKVPLSDIYSYYVEDVATGQKVEGTGYTDSAGQHKGGTVGTGGTVELGAGQRAVIVGIPAQSTYRVTEETMSGFRQTSSANTEGVVYASLTSTDAATASFENAYKTSGSFQLKATKALTGQKLGLYAFRFQAYQVFNAGTGDEYEQVVRSTSNSAGGDVDEQGVSTGEVTFGRIYVSDEDLGPDGTLTLLYRIREVNAGKAGYTYAINVEQVRVKLTDQGDGTIVATQTPEPVATGTSHIKPLEDGAAMVTENFHSNGDATFANSYNASGTLDLTAWKALKGGTLEAGQFTFRLNALTDGAPMATIKDGTTGALSYDDTIYDATTRSMTATNDASGVVGFPTIHLAGVHGGKSYIYKVSEDAGAAAGVNYSDEVYYYRVDVADDGAGTLTATTTVVKPKDDATGEAVAAGNPDAFESSDAQPIITNTLKPGNLSITKRLAQDSDYHNEEFEFKVVLTGNEIDENSSFGYKVGNAAAAHTTIVNSGFVATLADGLKGAWDSFTGLFAPSVAYAEGISKTDSWGSCPVTLESGVLTIGQEGGTYTLDVDSNNPYDSYPWHDWSEEEIRAIEQVRFVGTLHASKLQDLFNSDKLQDSSSSKRFVNLRTVDLGGLVPGDLENIQNMFYRCSSLESIGGTQGWTLSKCKNMKQVFYNCLDLDTIEGIETWKTPVVKDMHGMFNGCYDITALDLSGWDVSNVTDMEALFKHCEGLSSVNLTGWNTNSLTKMNEMFYDCSSLTTLDVSMLNTSNVGSMHGGGNSDGGVFEGCSSLQSVNVSGWDTSKITSTKRMFYNCLALQSLDLSSWNVGSLQDMSQMFQCDENKTSQLESVDLSGWNTASLQKMEATFQDCDSLSSVDFGGWNAPQLSSMYSAFARCGALESLDLSGFQTPNLTNLKNAFLNCGGLTSLNVNDLDVQQVSNMYNTFQGCSALTELDLSNWSTPALTNAVGLFLGCSNLERLNISQFNLGGCADANSVMSMFRDDAALKEVALSPGFKFYSGVENGNQLPDPPSGSAQYTGKWINSTDGNAEGKTAGELASSYTGVTDEGVYVWEMNENAYTVRFNANGGMGAMTSQALLTTATDPTPLNANAYSLPNNEFAGWNTKADGTGVSLDDRAEVTATSFTSDGSVVPAKSTVNLYAQWRAAGSEATKGSYTMTVRLKKDKTATITGIPADTSYQVFENTPAGWQLVEQSGTTGRITPLDTKEAVFTNNYEPATAKAQLYATKTLDGASAESGAFEFTLTGQGNAPMPDGSTNNAKTVSNGDVGLVDFGSITYTEAGTYTYTIVEKPGNDATINYDVGEWTATVTVANTNTDPAGDPVFAATVSYSNGADEPSSTPPAFANTTKPGDLTVQKVTMPEQYDSGDKDFNFTVRLQNSGQPVDSASYYIENADGTPLTTQSVDGRNLFTNALDAIGGLFTPTKAYAAVTDSGVFGENGSCTWEWDKDTKTVTVRATNEGTVGEWKDAHFNTTTYSAPWAIYDEQMGATYEEQMEHFVVAKDSNNGTTVAVSGSSNMSEMFRGLTNLKTVDLSGFDMTNYGSADSAYFAYVFAGSTNLTSVELPVFDGHPIAINHLFDGCTNLTEVSIPKMFLRSGNYNNISDFAAFNNCTSLPSVDLSGITIQQDKMRLDNMFYGCSSLTDVNMNIAESKNITSTIRMFYNCSNLRTINFKGFDATGLESISYMFRNCTSLTDLDLTDWNATALKEVNGAFWGCRSLRSLDISTLGFENVIEDGSHDGAKSMLREDTKLSKIIIGSGFRDLTQRSFSNYPENTPPSTGGYSGKWVMVEDTTKVKTYEQLMASDGRTDAGTWVWQVDPDYYYVANFKTNGAYYDTNNNAVPGSVTTPAAESITLPIPKWDTDAKTFAGWYREADFSGTKLDGGAAYNRTDLLGENPTSAYVTLYAKWTDNTSTTGTINVWKESTANDGTYLLDTSREYTFTQPTGQTETITPEAIDGFITPNAQNVTVAQGATVDFLYDRVAYTVKFNPNATDATGSMVDLPMVGGVAKKLTANAFEREGYGFLGWNTAANGSGTSYTDKQQVKNLAGNNETFTLYAQWAKGSSSQSSSTGTYSFALKAGQRVHFTNVPAGTTYSVVETDLPNGWTQTASSNTSGTVVATQRSDASVTNTYDATGVVSLQAQKTMASGALAEGQFSFQLLNADKTQVLQTKTNLAPADGTATAQVIFDQIDYTLGDLLKDGSYVDREYTYYIREVDDGQTGVRYDNGGDREVKVTVHDTGTGSLAVTPNNLQSTVVGTTTVTTSTTVFTNDYQPGSLKVSKTTVGTNEASANKKFSFKVALKDAQGEPVNNVSYDLVRIAEDGTAGATESVNFANGETIVNNIGADEAFRITGIAAGTTYEVTEVNVPGGFTQTAAAGTTGTIVAGDEAGDKSQASFTNTYAATGSVELTANKTLKDSSNVEHIADYTFSFQLYDGANKLLQTKTNDAAGNVKFDALGFSAADAGTQTKPKTYSYRVAEVNDAQEYVVYDTGSKWVTVSVWDDGEGNLHVTPAWDGGGATAKVENQLRHTVDLPATGGSGIAGPVAFVVIIASATGAYLMRRRRLRER